VRLKCTIYGVKNLSPADQARISAHRAYNPAGGAGCQWRRKHMTKETIKKYGKRVSYSEKELKTFLEGGHRIRHIERISEVAPQYSIEAEVVKSRNCNSGHIEGQKLIMDVDGNLISKYCPKRMCVYLVSQLTVPIAVINERFSEDLSPNDFHFMRYVRCPDVGVDCMGFGEVMLKVQVVPRINS
jgi:hypothetical protein